MRITRIESLHSKEPLTLPVPWKAAWTAPKEPPVTAFSYAFYKVYTDGGIVGIGPDTRLATPERLIGQDPFFVEALWQEEMSGRRAGNAGKGAAGIEIACWDIIGKAAGLPVYKLLGAHRDRQRVYAATSRLMAPQEMAEHVLMIRERGFTAVKLRLHRNDPNDDLEVVEAVRLALGSEMMILVDANQNNAGPGYPFWSRRTASRMTQALDALDVYYLEEPLPRTDVEGLAELAASVDMFIAGGEHTPTIYDFREHLLSGAYDIVQPDVILGGNYGITGVRKVAGLADYFGRLIVPHVSSGAHFAAGMAASLHAMVTVPNCPVLEYAYDPPILTPETCQAVVQEPLLVEEDGCVVAPDRPGLGLALDEEQLVVVARYE